MAKGRGNSGSGGKGDRYVFDVGADNKLSNRKLFTDFMIDGMTCEPDGVRCDVDGNL
jgi:gluconolactonase